MLRKSNDQLALAIYRKEFRLPDNWVKAAKDPVVQPDGTTGLLIQNALTGFYALWLEWPWTKQGPRMGKVSQTAAVAYLREETKGC